MAYLRPIELILGIEINDVVSTDTVFIERETIISLTEQERIKLFETHLQNHVDKNINTWYEIRDGG